DDRRDGDGREYDDKDTQDLLHGGVPFRGRRVTGIRWHGSSDTAAGFQVPRLCPKIRVHPDTRIGTRLQVFGSGILDSYGCFGGWAAAGCAAAGAAAEAGGWLAWDFR